jgi:hypothetical protein
MFGFSLETLSRWRQNSTVIGSSGRSRGEVKPPSLRCEPDSGWQRLRYWLLAPTPSESSPPLSQLPQIKADFIACLDDTPSDASKRLSLRIERARSLRELWHLRASLFDLVACEHSQSEAERRLRKVNRHFSSRRSTGLSPDR